MFPYKPLLVNALCLTVTTARQEKAGEQAPARTSFFDKSGMDTSVLPGNDFFAYVNCLSLILVVNFHLKLTTKIRLRQSWPAPAGIGRFS